MPMSNSTERIVIGTDHGGYELKSIILTHLQARNFDVNDMGVFSEEPVDYPDIISEVCKEYLSGSYSFAMALCGTGIGASITANKIKGIRCALVHDLYTAEKAKTHNNANVIALGGRIIYNSSVEKIIDTYIDAEFQDERHQRRIDKLFKLENEY